MTDQPTAEQIARSRMRLVLLALLFFGPMVCAWLFVRYGSGFVELEADSYGELVQPVITLEEFELTTQQVGLGDFQGIWTLLYPLTGSCDQPCEKLIHDTRQVRTALAKDMTKLQRVVLWQTTQDQVSLPLDDPARHPALNLYSGTAEQLAPLWSQLPPDVETALYLIDPMGNVMMRYPLSFEGKPLLKEIGFLIKNSVLG